MYGNYENPQQQQYQYLLYIHFVHLKTHAGKYFSYFINSWKWPQSTWKRELITKINQLKRFSIIHYIWLIGILAWIIVLRYDLLITILKYFCYKICLLWQQIFKVLKFGFDNKRVPCSILPKIHHINDSSVEMQLIIINVIQRRYLQITKDSS